MAKKHSPMKPTTQAPKVLSKVHFKYVFHDDYNPEYANGAHGGPTTQGEISIAFYVERNPLPIEESFAVSPDGQLSKPLGREPQLQDGTATVIRYVTTGVIMNLEVAKRVHDFLGKSIATLEAAMRDRGAAKKPATK